MARTKSDISNSAIRIFLQQVGKYYDEVRGLEPFGPSKKQKEALLLYFHHGCCFCGEGITVKTLSQDHLIPMNKKFLGLHAWGNVVPCCSSCNNEKHFEPWLEFLEKKAGREVGKRKALIDKFVSEKNYDPSLDLHHDAGNLYEDVGEVAMTLINLRYAQAQERIRRILA
jgi:hypothetical protein